MRQKHFYNLLIILVFSLLAIIKPQLTLAAISNCQATEMCQGMGLDPNTICNPITDEMACKANSCCRWLGLPAILVNNATQSTTETNQEQESKGPKLTIPELQIKLPGLVFSDQNKIQTITEGDQTFFYLPWIGEYIKWLYNYSIGIIGLLALLAIMIGGFYWIMAGGSASRVSEAKSWISAAISGLALALASYLLLFTINNELVKLPSIKMMAIKTIRLDYDIPSDVQSADAPTNGPSSHDVPLYYQCSAYAKTIYYPTRKGKCNVNLCQAGCGVLSTFMAINKFTKTLDLKEFTQEAINYGARETFNGKECNGSLASGLIQLVRSYGLQSNEIADGADEISQYLDRNCVVVISVGATDNPECKFTNGGHFIVLTGWRDKNQQMADVNDPVGDRPYPNRGDKTWISLKDWGKCRLSQKFYVCQQ